MKIVEAHFQLKNGKRISVDAERAEIKCEGNPVKCGFCFRGRCLAFEKDCCEMRTFEGVAVI